jgi:putative membrane protein
VAFLSDRDLTAISTAVRAAEARTSGEIVTVVAHASNSYLWQTFSYVGLLAFVAPGMIGPFAGLVASGDLFFVQLLALIVLGCPLLVPRFRFALVPHAIKRANAHRRAREQFLERGLHRTEGRTGVLIFVSVAERYVEILADDGINAKVEQAEWQGIVDGFVADVRRARVADGFLSAIAKVGDILARHVPAEGKNPDELPNRLFVI